MRASTLAILALAMAAIVYAPSSGAFDYVTMGRSVGAVVVANDAAYSAVVFGSTCQAGAGGSQCKGVFTITNKGTTDVTYRVLKTSDTSSELEDYGFGGAASVASGWTTPTEPVPIASPVMMIVNLSSCLAFCTSKYYANFTVEAQKADILTVNQTRLMIMYQSS